MASRPDTYQYVTLDIESPWNLAGASTHTWHCTFNLSGTINHSQTEAEALALDLFGPIKALSHPGSLIGWSYCPQGSTVSTASATYPPGTHGCDGSGYVSLGSGTPQQLEVSALCRCYVDKNVRGKPVYLRKWIHGVLASTSDPNALAGRTDDSVILTNWNHGAGPHACVPVDPTGGQQGTGWTIESHLYTHQLRKGRKKPKAKASNGAPSLGDLLDLGLTAAQAALFLARYFPK